MSLKGVMSSYWTLVGCLAILGGGVAMMAVGAHGHHWQYAGGGGALLSIVAIVATIKLIHLSDKYFNPPRWDEST